MTAKLNVVRKKELVRTVNVTRSEIEAALGVWDKNAHEWLNADPRQRAVRYNNKYYPPKEIARLTIELKDRLPSGHLQSHGLTVENTKNCFEALGFDYLYASDSSVI